MNWSFISCSLPNVLRIFLYFGSPKKFGKITFGFSYPLKPAFISPEPISTIIGSFKYSTLPSINFLILKINFLILFMDYDNKNDFYI